MDEQQKATLKVGDNAPDFKLKSSTGGEMGLSDLKGRPAVIIFYPFDWSGPCTSQLNIIQEVLPEFEQYDAQVIGISADSIFSHKAWAEQMHLSFPILSDWGGKTIAAFGVANPDGAANRVTIVLDKDGKVLMRDEGANRGVVPEVTKVFETLEQQGGVNSK